MKNELLIISLSALTLFSCGGSQKQNQNQTTEIKDTVNTVSDGKLADCQIEPEIEDFIKNDGGLGGYDVFKFSEDGVLIDIWDAPPNITAKNANTNGTEKRW